jgi:glycine cleavage system H protein
VERAVAEIRSDLQYTKEHEYVRPAEEDGVVYVGITDYAQGELGDVVYVELPQVGRTLGSHEVFGTIEAVKAVSELYSPLAGEVVEINPRLDGEPALVNSDPYGDGWMIKLRVSGDSADLMDSAAYSSLIGQLLTAQSAERRVLSAEC